MIYLISTMKLKPGSAETARAAAALCRVETLKEPGCISYDLMQSASDPDTFAFVERWRDRAAIDTHFKTAHLQAWREVAAKIVLSRHIEIIHPDHVETLG